MGREAVRIGQEKYSTVIAAAMKLSTRLIPEDKRMRVILEKFLEDRNERYPSQVKTPAELQEEENFVIVNKD